MPHGDELLCELEEQGLTGELVAFGSPPAFSEPRRCPAAAPAVGRAEVGTRSHVPPTGAARGLSTVEAAVSLCSWQMGTEFSWL